MNLDDLDYFDKLDTQRMIDFIDRLPTQLQSAWEAGNHLALPPWSKITRVVVAGMGGSAIGADLLGAYLFHQCPVPFHVHRDYDLPAWAQGEETLVVVSSHSGETEEVLSAYRSALERRCRLLVITTGGQLAKLADQAGIPAWRYQHPGPPRSAVGFSFGLLLAVIFRLGLLEDPTTELSGSIQVMQEQQNELKTSVPAALNPAKRLAGQLMGRWVSVIGAGILAPVARRWKGQINELAKSWAQFEILPEADHNTLAGVLNPEELLAKTFVLFLRGTTDSTHNQLRSKLTRQTMMLEGLNTDFLNARGDTRLANLWTCLHFGDYTAYYLAMAYGMDPSPVPAIENLKKELLAADRSG